MKHILLASILVLVMAVGAAAVDFSADQLAAFHARLAAARDGITTLQSGGQIRIGGFQYGKLLYHFNYSINRMFQAVAAARVGGAWQGHFTAARDAAMTVSAMLDDMDSSHKITFVTAQGEVGFLRTLLALGKLINEMVH